MCILTPTPIRLRYSPIIAMPYNRHTREKETEGGSGGIQVIPLLTLFQPAVCTDSPLYGIHKREKPRREWSKRPGFVMVVVWVVGRERVAKVKKSYQIIRLVQERRGVGTGKILHREGEGGVGWEGGEGKGVSWSGGCRGVL